jgi:hypothetical protein
VHQVTNTAPGISRRELIAGSVGMAFAAPFGAAPLLDQEPIRAAHEQFAAWQARNACCVSGDRYEALLREHMEAWSEDNRMARSGA